MHTGGQDGVERRHALFEARLTRDVDAGARDGRDVPSGYGRDLVFFDGSSVMMNSRLQPRRAEPWPGDVQSLELRTEQAEAVHHAGRDVADDRRLLEYQSKGDEVGQMLRLGVERLPVARPGVDASAYGDQGAGAPQPLDLGGRVALGVCLGSGEDPALLRSEVREACIQYDVRRDLRHEMRVAGGCALAGSAVHRKPV